MKYDQSLTNEQRELVEASIPIARWTVRKYIDINESVVGLGLDDLTQEAYVALCKAAATYNDSYARFNTYAVAVIRNHLLDYCRRIQTAAQNMPVLPLDTTLSPESTSSFLTNICDTGDNFEDECLSKMWAADFLSRRKETYRGCARLGLDALELKVLDGYGVTDIANLYQVKPNLVGAWISKATQKIRSDITTNETFMLGVEKNVSIS